MMSIRNLQPSLLNAVLALIVLVGSAGAQVNTEKLRREREKSGISGDIEFTYLITRGNSELTEIGFSPNFVWRSGPHKAFTLNSFERVTADDDDVINKGFSHLRYNYDLTETYIYEAFLQIQYNREQDLKRRFLVGTGVRIEAIEGEKFLLAVGATAMFEKEELESGKETSIIRGSNYLNIRYRKDGHWSLINTIYVQPKLDDWSDIRILDEAVLSVWIIKNLAITNTLDLLYDSEPPDNVEDYDLEFKTGLKFTF